MPWVQYRMSRDRPEMRQVPSVSLTVAKIVFSGHVHARRHASQVRSAESGLAK